MFSAGLGTLDIHNKLPDKLAGGYTRHYERDIASRLFHCRTVYKNMTLINEMKKKKKRFITQLTQIHKKLSTRYTILVCYMRWDAHFFLWALVPNHKTWPCHGIFVFTPYSLSGISLTTNFCRHFYTDNTTHTVIWLRW